MGENNYNLAGLYQAIKEKGTELHALVVIKDGKTVVRSSAAPYTCTDKREMYSVSKSFTSTAFGIAYDWGLVSPQDPVLRWFPEYVDVCARDERWQRVKLHHLLTMSVGHASCVMDRMTFAADSMKAFFEQPLVMEPGSSFVYNTGATCAVAEVVRRAMGMPVPEVLARFVFPYIGIEDFRWEKNLDGRCAGGVGLAISCEDLSKLGLLYLNKGMAGEHRVLSEEWVEMASGNHIDNSGNGHHDWCAGYGYQFWHNAAGGYRADGAFGQVCFILPEQNVVFAAVAETNDMGLEMETLQNAVSQLVQGVDAQTGPAYEPAGAWNGTAMDSGWVSLQGNTVGWKAFRLQTSADEVTFKVMDGDGVQTVHAVPGIWQENTLYAGQFRPSLYTFLARPKGQPVRMAVSVHSDGDAVILECRCLNAPHHFDMQFVREAEGWKISLKSSLDVFGPEKYLQEKQTASDRFAKTLLTREVPFELVGESAEKLNAAETQTAKEALRNEYAQRFLQYPLREDTVQRMLLESSGKE